jgi:hypothetical protein
MWLYNNELPHSEIGGIPSRKLLDAIETMEILFLASVIKGGLLNNKKLTHTLLLLNAESKPLSHPSKPLKIFL